MTASASPPPMLKRVVTSDGCVLDGALHASEAGHSSDTALVIVHGTGSSFYSPGPLETLADHAARNRLPALRINTRGHDGMATIPGLPRGQRGGAAYETVSDCRLDLAAWIQFASDHIASQVVLVGHSMGGVKCVYSQALAADARVAGILCLSPPRFCHEHWMRHPQAEPFRASFAQAQQAVAAGHPDTLLQCRQPVPLVVTAQGFLDKYGPHDDYDIVRRLPEVTCPTLVLIGEKTIASSPAFDSLPAELSRLSDRQPSLSWDIVPDADMSYSARPAEPFERLQVWIGLIEKVRNVGIQGGAVS